MVLESESGTLGDGDVRVLKHDCPFAGIIDAFPCVGGVVRIPSSGDGLGKVNFGVGGDDERAVGAIGTGDVDGGEAGSCGG